MKKNLLVVLCLGLVGCMASSQNLNRLSLGMSKAEVIKSMGNPSTVKADNGVEILEYRLFDVGDNPFQTQPHQYWITLQNGEVVRYGRAGDFGTAMPEDRREYNLKIQSK